MLPSGREQSKNAARSGWEELPLAARVGGALEFKL
jgi:hypothetical protein